MAGGALEGMAEYFTAPLDVALIPAGLAGRAAKPFVVRAVAAYADAQRALAAARAARRLDEIPELTRQLEVARQSMHRAQAVETIARTTERARGLDSLRVALNGSRMRSLPRGCRRDARAAAEPGRAERYRRCLPRDTGGCSFGAARAAS
jgi:hypothetical protein